MNVRDTFFTMLYEKTKRGNDIVVVSSDLGAPSLDNFRKDFPQRFINTGIAEQNAIAVAAGLSLSGKTAITYGLNPFPVTRAFDQVRNIMAAMKIPVTVAGLKAGTCTAEAGFSHMAIENISLLRTLHNIQIISPSDVSISKMIVNEILRNPVPRYVQFDPFINEKLYEEQEIDFSRGFVVSGMDCDTVVVSYGIWSNRIKKEAIPVKLVDCFSLPINIKDFIQHIKNCKKIITIEDGVDSGGIGSMVLEILSDYRINIPVKRFSLKFKQGYPEVISKREMIFEREGLTMDFLIAEIGGLKDELYGIL